MIKWKICIEDKEISILGLKLFRSTKGAISITTEPEQLESIRSCLVKVSSVNFEKDLKWRFSMDSIKFYATIADDDFLKSVETGEISFTKGTSLLVDLHEIQTLHSNGDVKNDYEIMKVHRIIGQNQQLTLPFQ